MPTKAQTYNKSFCKILNTVRNTPSVKNWSWKIKWKKIIKATVTERKKDVQHGREHRWQLTLRGAKSGDGGAKERKVETEISVNFTWTSTYVSDVLNSSWDSSDRSVGGGMSWVTPELRPVLPISLALLSPLVVSLVISLLLYSLPLSFLPFFTYLNIINMDKGTRHNPIDRKIRE